MIANDFREAARVVGVKPHQVQAVIWLTWRRLHGVRQEVDPGLGQAPAKSRGPKLRIDGGHNHRTHHVHI